MSMGNWTPGEEKERPGLYNRFISTALSRVKTGASGIVGMPVKADWGPLNELVDIESESDVIKKFGESGEGCTTYLLNRCLLGGKKYKPKKIIAYRIAGASAAEASATIEDSLKLSARAQEETTSSILYPRISLKIQRKMSSCTRAASYSLPIQ